MKLISAILNHEKAILCHIAKEWNSTYHDVGDIGSLISLEALIFLLSKTRLKLISSAYR